MRATLIDPWTDRGSPLRLLAPPEWSLREHVGFEQAALKPAPTLTQEAHLERSIVMLEGPTGAVFFGFVNNRPARDGTVLCPGYNNILLQSRREALYLDTATSEWREQTLASRSQAFRPQIDGAVIRMVMEAGHVLAGGEVNGMFRHIPATAGSKVTFDWTTTSANWVWTLYYGTYAPDAATGAEVASWTDSGWSSSGTSGSADVTINAAHDVLLLQMARSGAATTVNESHTIANLKVYGVDGVISTATSTIIEDIIDTDVPAAYKLGPNPKSYIAAEATAPEPLVFTIRNGLTANDKVQALIPLTTYHAGWYSENDYPYYHWQPYSTTPDWILDISEASNSSIEDGTVEQMASAIRVHFADEQGRAQHVDVLASDYYPEHYLVQIGEVVWAPDIDVPTTSSATATSIGVLILADLGRRQVKGSGTWASLRTAQHADVPATLALPGQMVRLLRKDGYSDTILRRASFVGEASVSLELDNYSNRLSRAIAQLSKGSPAGSRGSIRDAPIALPRTRPMR